MQPGACLAYALPFVAIYHVFYCVFTKFEYLFYVWTNRICMHEYIPERESIVENGIIVALLVIPDSSYIHYGFRTYLE